MNLTVEKTFHYLGTRIFPGIPLTKDGIIGFTLPDTPEKTIAQKIQIFANSQNVDNIYSFITCIIDNLEKKELEAIKEYLPNVTHIGNFGVGFNHIDIDYAKNLGFRVTNSPGVLTEATADIAFTLLLCVTRRVAEGYSIVKNTSKYPGWAPDYLLGTSLQNKTLGIVGYGEIGKALAKRAKAFGLKCVALKSNNWDSIDKNSSIEIERLSENDFFKVSDIISLNCPLTEQSKNWLNQERISKIKQGAVIINTARGELIDEPSLADALNNNHLSGAGLDVFCHEPVLSEHLKTAKNIFILPHIGSATHETRQAMGGRVFDSIKAHFKERQELRQKGVLPFQIK
ncbi:D-glycerate dehydrogenase [Silvanigrella paludirubra]|uniref:D-glycerate dehydrogenase n=1 Tax=Silvanigrella paludirubra TaxID=2499159 RepID=A0A6N6VVA8_9BACT|nr:NAD(P)-dependent oxidoreductase [Silvanigrella paludirubra]KAB8039794.1 D-glycerate dehydrogenase [Silvanigrella paludirubra]